MLSSDSGSAFKISSTEFIPGAPAKADFPSFGEDSGGFEQNIGKKTKGDRQKEEQEKARLAKQAEMEALPTKGKPSNFFNVKRD